MAGSRERSTKVGGVHKERDGDRGAVPGRNQDENERGQCSVHGAFRLPFVYAIGRDESKVELYIDRGTGQGEANKRIFDRLYGQRKGIEETFGGELSWQRLDDKRACRIASIITAGGYRDDESKWPEIQDAMVDAMDRLQKALTPHLAMLKTELASRDT